MKCLRLARFVGIVALQPPGNLLGRLVQHQFTRNGVPQLAAHGQQTSLRAQGRIPSLLVRVVRLPVSRENSPNFRETLPSMNGFANRFLWICSRRSKSLPESWAR